MYLYLYWFICPNTEILIQVHLSVLTKFKTWNMLIEKCSHRMHINDMLQGQITNPSQGYTCCRESGIVNTKITFNDHSI